MKECPSCNRCFLDNVNHCPSDGDALRFTIAGDTVLDGRYQLERRLGQGGMGVVFKGRHVFLKTQHAIKVILPDLVGNDPSLVTRFRQEAMAAAAIRHQNIISVTDFGVVNNTTPFLVMEFLDGCSLHELLSAEKRFHPARALEIMLAVAAGVGAAHRQGIVHRDLKPLNIMLRGDCSAGEGLKVLDFGLAKIKSGDLLGSFVAAKTQGLMGSPFYMAPEQWGDDEPDARSDIYSLGVILYQMLAGEVPFKGNSIPSIMKKHLAEPPPPLSEKGVGVPPEVERVVLGALEKEPDNRPQTVEEFIVGLRVALDAVNASTPMGADTNPDVGLQVVAPQKHEAAPRGAPVSGALQAPDVLVGGKTIADGGQPVPDTARGLNTIASPDALRAEVPPPMNNPPSRDTAGDLAGGTALIVEPEDGKKEEKEGSAHAGSSIEPPRAHAQHVHPSAGPEGGVARTAAQKTYAAPPNETEPSKTPPQPGNQFAGVSPELSQVTVVRPLPQAAAPHAGAASPMGVSAPRAADVSTPRRPRMPVAVWAAVGVVALLCVVAGLYILLKDTSQGGAETNANASVNAGATASPQPGATPFRPELVSLTGGAFLMGRDDVPPRTSNVSLTYQAWVYNQWPAHQVSIAPFRIDKTEVTNAEYVEFVEKGGHTPPPNWEGKRPPAGQERWPVSNVSLDDIERFARWRSERDGVAYRLPTEAEWEYAARGGEASRLYPWGREWADARANLETDAVKPVASFPEGATPQGVHDMIGNVWEWTATEARMYRGNNLLVLAPGDQRKIVVRGGSYQSKARGDEPITATARRWVTRDRKDPLIGFRLVSPGR